MSLSKQPTFFGSLMRQVRRIASAFREKPTVVLDDYILEHFTLYHGLVGSTPQDQPQFKDVRADIFEAIQKRSSVEMAIALKLPPLWWEDRLIAIIGEAHQYREELLACLLPPGNEIELLPDADPLRHTDWRVRSNAALLLAQLNATEAIPKMVAALNDAEGDFKASFSHLIYALARLQTPETQQVVASRLDSPEPWFRVDAVGALAKWPLLTVAPELTRALLNPHSLNDYAAVSVTRSISAMDLLTLPGDKAESGLEVIIGLVQAARGPFSADTAFGATLDESFERVYQMAQEKTSPRRIRALLELAAYIIEFSEDTDLQKRAEFAKQEFSDPKYAEMVLGWFNADHAQNEAEFRHAMNLAAHYKLKSAEPFILPHLNLDSYFLDEAIEATATIGGAETAPRLVQLINQLVDIEDRTNRPLSKQNVFEEKAAQAKTYWLSLKALGNLPYDQSADLLLKATHDFAPDKRQQALASLVHIATDSAVSARRQQIVDSVRAGLTDPAPSVRVAALSGVERLAVLDLIPEAVRMTAAKENAVVRQARRTLAHLAQDGHAALVTQSLKSALASERDAFRRQRLGSLLDDVSQR